MYNYADYAGLDMFRKIVNYLHESLLTEQQNLSKDSIENKYYYSAPITIENSNLYGNSWERITPFKEFSVEEIAKYTYLGRSFYDIENNIEYINAVWRSERTYEDPLMRDYNTIEYWN